MRTLAPKTIATLPGFAEHVVLIDGITRAGKFWLGNVLNHFANVDQFRYDHAMDFVSILAAFGAMESRAAVALMRSMMSIHAYDNCIGRYLNQQAHDSSSIYRNPSLPDYLRRMSTKVSDQQQVIEDMRSASRLFPFVVHDCLVVPETALAALDELKILRIERNPADLAFAWHVTGLGKDRMRFSHRIEGRGGTLPWFAADWAEEFEEMGEMDRIIRSILHLEQAAIQRYAELEAEDQRRIAFTAYEWLGTDPSGATRAIGQFLQVEPLPQMAEYCAGRAFAERSLDRILAARAAKLQTIGEFASTEALRSLVAASEAYDQRLRALMASGSEMGT